VCALAILAGRLANEALLLDYARFMTASQLEETCRKYALVLRHGQDPHPLGDLQRRYVRRRDTEDGMVKLEAVLHPEEAESIWTMLTHAAGQLVRARRFRRNVPADERGAVEWQLERRARTAGRRTS
jgi:hypothetical protein